MLCAPPPLDGRTVGLGGSLALAAALALALPACEAFDDQGEVVTDYCEMQRVDRIRPRDETTDAYANGWAFVTLDCPVDEGNISVETLQGEPATGSVMQVHSGYQIRYRPQPPFAPNTTYQARLDIDGGFSAWRFATSALGQPTGTVGLAEHAMAFRPLGAILLDPPGMEESVEVALADFTPAVQFTGDAAGGTVPVRLGGALLDEDGDPQDMDQPTWSGEARWQDPYWELGPLDLSWRLPDFDLVVEDAVLSGSVAPDLIGGGGGMLEGLWDSRGGELLLGGESPCEVAVSAGAEGCVACRDGSVSCMPLRLVHMGAIPWFGHLEAR